MVFYNQLLLLKMMIITYTLVAGERRLRAQNYAEISKIKAIIIDADELKLKEN